MLRFCRCFSRGFIFYNNKKAPECNENKEGATSKKTSSQDPHECCDEKTKSGVWPSGGTQGKNSDGTHIIYKTLSLVLAIPLMAIATFVLVKGPNEDEERPPFIPYDHLRIRTKPFPWGDGTKTLFHNPRVNPLPEGYEDEIEYEDMEMTE